MVTVGSPTLFARGGHTERARAQCTGQEHVMDWLIHKLPLPFPRPEGSCSKHKCTSTREATVTACKDHLPSADTDMPTGQPSMNLFLLSRHQKAEAFKKKSLFPTQTPNGSTLPLRLSSITLEVRVIPSSWRHNANTSGRKQWIRELTETDYSRTYSCYYNYSKSQYPPFLQVETFSVAQIPDIEI